MENTQWLELHLRQCSRECRRRAGPKLRLNLALCDQLENVQPCGPKNFPSYLLTPLNPNGGGACKCGRARQRGTESVSEGKAAGRQIRVYDFFNIKLGTLRRIFLRTLSLCIEGGNKYPRSPVLTWVAIWKLNVPRRASSGNVSMVALNGPVPHNSVIV